MKLTKTHHYHHHQKPFQVQKEPKMFEILLEIFPKIFPKLIYFLLSSYFLHH